MISSQIKKKYLFICNFIFLHKREVFAIVKGERYKN